MSNLLKSMKEDMVISPPEWIPSSTIYLTKMGSQAYGVANSGSDIDLYGICVPPKEIIFPNLKGLISGFDEIPSFNQFQQHGINGYKGKDYDVVIFNIIKFFKLTMANNPNMLDSIFTPDNCVIHMNEVGKHIRDNRKLFLHKGSFHKMIGYSYSQLHKMDIKKPKECSNRYEDVKKHGYSTKFAYHIIRLLNEAEQILMYGDLDLQQNKEQLKSVRRGEWTSKDIHDYFDKKEEELTKLYISSDAVPHKPDTKAIKSLLMDCLEMYYGSLEKMMSVDTENLNKLDKIAKILGR